MSNFTTDLANEAWLDGWEAAEYNPEMRTPSYGTSTECEAFVAGLKARREHIRLGYLDDVPLPVAVQG